MLGSDMIPQADVCEKELAALAERTMIGRRIVFLLQMRVELRRLLVRFGTAGKDAIVL
jgi:hypothetical protein